MTSAINTATAGMNAAADRFDQSAAKIAQIGTDVPDAATADPATEAVNLIQASDSFVMNANVAKAGANMAKRLVDMIA